MQKLTEEHISDELAADLLEAIKEKRWWQGSVIPAASLHLEVHSSVNFWVIATQACNIYNSCFEKVPVFELVAARQIDQCASQMIKGDNPRILHVEAQSEDDTTIALEIDIQKRQWLRRSQLANIPKSTFHIRDANKFEMGTDWTKKLWLDNFIGWLARSYTRIALPDAFNDAMRASRIDDVLKNKLTKHKDALYGIYLSIEADTDDGWHGILGEMPPPYQLSLWLVTYEDSDPEELKNDLFEQLFSIEIQDPENKTQKIARANLARRHNIRIIKSAIEARTIAGITLLDLKPLIRYTFIDHLSDSSIVASS